MSLTIYGLRDSAGVEVFRGTIDPPPGGGSQPGLLTSADFLFTEVADTATYEASLPVLAGTVVADVILYILAGPWAADDPVNFTMGDTLTGPTSYFGNTNLVLYSPAYDPVNLATGSNWTDLINGGNNYANAAWNAIDSVGPNGPGVRYAADDEIVMSVVSNNAAPVVPAGLLLVKIVYFAPVTAVAAVVT